MKNFQLTALVTISVTTEVQAETLEEAINIAEKRPNMQVNLDPFYTEKEYWVTEGELDGSLPYKTRDLK